MKGKRQWSIPLSRADERRGFRGWYEDGYLPHRDEPGLVQFVSFRLADSFPAALRAEWESLLKIEDDRQRHIRLESYLDLGRGECFLRRADIASLVENSLRFGHPHRCQLRAWVVMPNHVHVLFQVHDVPMPRLVDAWKGYSAKAANRLLGRKGRFWEVGYWDTYMRDSEHETRVRCYIENNPVKAGLAKFGKEWPWSSSRFRDSFERLCLPN